MRPVTDTERQAVEAGLRSSDAFVLRRCQVLLASSRGERPPQIARNLRCASQTARNAIRALNVCGLDVLTSGSTAPKQVSRVFDGQHAEDLKVLLHQSPRQFGKHTSVRTLDLAAQVSFEQGVTSQRVSDETVRQALKRLGVGWKRAKRWLTSPDPEYARKRGSATG